MLVLSRKPTEQILLELPTGDFITITNVKATPHSCKIGIEAPEAVRIVRRELVTPQAITETAHHV